MSKMKFTIPFTFSSVDKLKKRTGIFKKLFNYKKGTRLESYLKNSGEEITREEYLAVCVRGFVISFIISFLLASPVFVFLQISYGIFLGLSISILFAFFIYFSMLIYPRVYHNRRQRDIDRNLIPALQDVLVQLNSGVPLFSILINISTSDYGELSEEFVKMVKKINAGYSEIGVFDESGEDNSSLFYRRALWQISNGMRAGGDISNVIEQSVKTLTDEQYIQIQIYGNKLNPTIMFYMLISVIIPALGITFLTVISSILNLPQFLTTFVLIGMFVMVLIIQAIFMGVIKSIRPSLL